MNLKHIALSLISVFFFLSSFAQKPSHQTWDVLLKKHVNAGGMVNYKGFLNDKAQLDSYLKTLSNNAPQASWKKDEQKAFWINAYNAFTVSLILENYPVKSIKDIAGKIYKVNTPWDLKFISIGGKKYDLNNIEHGILRKQFDDPRIHFALVCASVSCPKLRREAYTPDRLNMQLEEAGRDFLNDPGKNKISASRADLSKYFSWYKSDFIKKEPLHSFINRYSKTKIDPKTKIGTLEYDWSLNEQK